MDNITVVDEIQADSFLLRLDDYLLLDIIKSLHITDVINVAETCQRLSTLANEHIEKQRLDIIWNRNDNPDFKQAERFYKYVGKSVRIVKLLEWNDSDLYKVLMLVAKTCPNIDGLYLNNIQMLHFHFHYDASVMTMLSKLKRFEMHSCFWIGWRDCPLNLFFGKKSLLEVLIVTGHWFNYSNYQLPLQLARLRTLKKLQLANCTDSVNRNQLQRCIENNTITDISLTDVNSMFLLDGHGHLIDGLISTVESVTMDIDQKLDLNLDNLLKFRKMRRLRLSCQSFRTIDEFLSKLGDSNNIEELEVRKINITMSTIGALSKFNKLTKLNFDIAKNQVERQFFGSLSKILPNLQQLTYTNSNINDEGIIAIFKSMANLKSLNLHGCNSLELETYLTITKILKADKRLRKLEFIAPKTSPAILKYLESGPLVVHRHNKMSKTGANEFEENPKGQLKSFYVKFSNDVPLKINPVNQCPFHFGGKYILKSTKLL